MENKNIELFETKPIRKVWHNEEWHFSLIDVIEVLTDSPTPHTYWEKLKKRELQLSPFWGRLKLLAKDSKMRPTDCANTEGVLRAIMSVPSPKAEPFKLWLANLGTRELAETEDPELGYERIRNLYKAKGYPDDWIGYRVKTIDTRKELTDEWKNRHVKEGQEYSILTAIIAKGTFGVTPIEHKAIKNLKKENLRDHMTNLELLFTALSEETAKQYAVDKDATGFKENQIQAAKAGHDTGVARDAYEKQTGIKVLSPKNHLKELNQGEEQTDGE